MFEDKKNEDRRISDIAYRLNLVTFLRDSHILQQNIAYIEQQYAIALPFKECPYIRYFDKLNILNEFIYNFVDDFSHHGIDFNLLCDVHQTPNIVAIASSIRQLLILVTFSNEVVKKTQYIVLKKQCISHSKFKVEQV